MNNQLFINKINLIIFLFCCSLSLWSNYLNQYITPLVSLFVILILGTSHGALDNYKGSILLKHYRIKNIFIFYFIYLLISLIFFSLWFYIPSVLIIFLLVASYHFGKEDSEILKHDASISSRIIYFIKGSLIIFAPLYFQFEETVNLFELINLDVKYLYFLKNNNLIISIFYISIFSNLYFLKKFNFLKLKIICLDISSIILLFYFLSPLVA
ncbi:MAG: Brp/Blh family beta-carotene 15,15'-dioxygenase, partial [Pelagibacteraceae bacterium]